MGLTDIYNSEYSVTNSKTPRSLEVIERELAAARKAAKDQGTATPKGLAAIYKNQDCGPDTIARLEAERRAALKVQVKEKMGNEDAEADREKLRKELRKELEAEADQETAALKKELASLKDQLAKATTIDREKFAKELQEIKDLMASMGKAGDGDPDDTTTNEE